MTDEYDPKKVQDTISCLENAKMLIPYYPYGFGEYSEFVHGLIDEIEWHIDHIIDQVKAVADYLENDPSENEE